MSSIASSGIDFRKSKLISNRKQQQQQQNQKNKKQKQNKTNKQTTDKQTNTQKQSLHTLFIMINALFNQNYQK